MYQIKIRSKFNNRQIVEISTLLNFKRKYSQSCSNNHSPAIQPICINSTDDQDILLELDAFESSESDFYRDHFYSVLEESMIHLLTVSSKNAHMVMMAQV